MGTEHDTDQPDQLRSDLSADEQTAADKAGQDAFALAFGEDAPAPADRAAAERQADAPAGDTGGEQTDDDPFKDLHPKVRDMLAEVPTLKRNYDALQGRLAPTQRKLAELERENAELKARTAAAPAPANAAVDRVRGELPEVAEAIESAVQEALGKLAQQEPRRDQSADHAADDATVESAEAKALGAKHADWREVMPSTDYRLWVASKGTDYQNEMMSTNDPEKVSVSISEFKAHKKRAEGATRQALDDNARRNNRTAGAVAPTGGRSAPPGDRSQMSEHDAMIEAFNSP